MCFWAKFSKSSFLKIARRAYVVTLSGVSVQALVRSYDGLAEGVTHQNMTFDIIKY